MWRWCRCRSVVVGAEGADAAEERIDGKRRRRDLGCDSHSAPSARSGGQEPVAVQCGHRSADQIGWPAIMGPGWMPLMNAAIMRRAGSRDADGSQPDQLVRPPSGPLRATPRSPRSRSRPCLAEFGRGRRRRTGRSPGRRRAGLWEGQVALLCAGWWRTQKVGKVDLAGEGRHRADDRFRVISAVPKRPRRALSRYRQEQFM